MPEIVGLPPTGPAAPGGPGAPQGGALPPGQTPGTFRAHLDAKLAARRSRQTVPEDHVRELVRFFNDRGEAFESVRLVTKYPPIEKDDALYEVRTDSGVYRVIRSRDGSYTLFT
jgi:hypothetical protein